MNRTKNIFSILFLLAAFLIFGCKSTQTAQQDLVKMPEYFEGRKDTLTSASRSWKEYFKDPALTGLIDTALKNNLDLLMAFQRIESARSNVRLSKGAMLPAVDAFASASRRKFGLYTMDGAGNITTPIDGDQLVPIHLPDYYVGFQTSWELDVWGKLRNKKVAALSRYLASVEGRNWAITNIVTEVASNYYELLSLDQQLDIIRETIALQENAFNIITIQKQAGMANELAVQQFEAQFINSKAFELEIKQNIIETENRLNFLLGRYPQTISRDKDVFTASLPVNPHVGLPSDLLRYRPDVKQAELDLLAAKADVKSARAAFYPSFNITGAYGFQAFKTAYLFTSPQSTAYTLLGSLTAPLINRSAIKADFRNAKAMQINAMHNYQKTILNGYIEVYNELFSIRNLETVYSLKNREVQLLSQSIETSTELFRTGRASYLEIIVTQQKALQSKLELVSVKKRQFDSTLNLYKALGGGWVQ
jgi:NodT family efflux transporter outer membrane factor (OMF) lipoprotein